MADINNESLYGSKAFWYDKEGKDAPWYEHRIRKLEADLKEMKKSRDSWQAEARRYAKNAEYWRDRYERETNS